MNSTYIFEVNREMWPKVVKEETVKLTRFGATSRQ